MKLKWYQFILCLVVIFVGVFSLIELNDMFNKKSNVIGHPIVIEDQMDAQCVYKTDLGSILLEKQKDNTYTYTQNTYPIEFDGVNNEYRLMFNNKLLHSVEQSAGKISGIFTETFRDTENNVSAVIDLHVEVVTTISGTSLTMTSYTNENNSVGYLYTYTSINGAILKIIKL